MFKPRQIEERKEIFERIKAKEAQRLKGLTRDLTTSIKGLNATTDPDQRGQAFLTGLFTGCLVKTDQKEHPNTLYLFDRDNNLLLECDTKDQEIWISLSNVFEPLEQKMKQSQSKHYPVDCWREIKTWAVKHLTPLKSYEIYPYKWSQYHQIEELFKSMS